MRPPGGGSSRWSTTTWSGLEWVRAGGCADFGASRGCREVIDVDEVVTNKQADGDPGREADTVVEEVAKSRLF